MGKFHIGDAISLDFLQEMGQSARASDAILSVMTVLDDIPAVALTDAEAKSFNLVRSCLWTGNAVRGCVPH